MQFFLYEIAARIVAIYLCVDCGRIVWNALVERKIVYFHHNTDLLDWLVDLFQDRPKWVAHRDATPVCYWIQIAIQIFLLISCLVVAIFGWWHPDT
jgi:hypothetical protein